MSWILDGQRVKAKYYGIPVAGVVTAIAVLNTVVKCNMP
jgi:hypothetical protein